MSYVDLKGNVELVNSHINASASILTWLSLFFKEYKRLNEAYSKSLETMVKAMSGKLLQHTSSLTTLRIALDNFLEFIQLQIRNFSYITQNTQIELIEPLDLFHENFLSTNNPGIKKAMSEEKAAKMIHDELEKSRSTYLSTCEQSENAESKIAEAFVNGNLNENQLQKLTRNACDIKNQTEADANKLRIALTAYNQRRVDANRMINPLLETLQQSQESWIHFVKYSLEKFVRHQTQVSQLTYKKSAELSEVLVDINSVVDITSYVEQHRESVSDSPLKFVSYEQWKKQTQEETEETKVSVPARDHSEDKATIKRVLDLIVPIPLPGPIDLSEQDGEIDMELKGNVIDILQSSDGRMMFYKQLSKRRTYNWLKMDALENLTVLFNGFLSAMLIEEDDDPQIFYKVLQLCQHYFGDSNGRREYLNTRLLQHPIWNDSDRWIDSINFVIETRSEEERESSRAKKKSKQSLFGQLRTSLLVGLRGGETPNKSTAFMVLSEFNFYMINLGLNLEEASVIVLSVSQHWSLDTERVWTLLAELQANQHSTRTVSRDTVRKSLRKREKEKRHWGNLIQYGLALAWLEPRDLMSLVCVCKRFNREFSSVMMNTRLQRLNPADESATEVRTHIWRQMLYPDNYNVDYDDILSTINKDVSLNKYDDVIQLDVDRSYRYNNRISDDNLSNILRVYAFFNPEIGYCQGMNYIAGTLYLQFQSEQDAFAIMVGLVEKFRMTYLYFKELPKLKLFFYQLDRLIGILLPEVHDHFKEEMISSSHFSSPWFMTLFTSVLQTRPILLEIWDAFIFEGWKIIFKIWICILGQLREQIIHTSFEHILSLVNNVGSEKCPVQMFDDQFMQKVRDIKVSESLLRDLESEFEHLKIRAAANPKKYNFSF